MQNRTVVGIVAAGSATLWLITSITPSGPELERWAFDFAAVGVTEGDRYAGVTIEVRPPHFEWWLGWNFEACRPGDPALAPQPVFRCEYSTPVAWGCHEMRVYRRDVVQVMDAMQNPPQMVSEALSSVPSNELAAGTCPDPMPERIPLATPEAVAAPEPDPAVALALGALALVGYRRLADRARGARLAA